MTHRHERGFVLITGLLFLIAFTVLGLAMLRSFGLQERIAGNTQDKQRAFSAAHGALQLAERWLADGNGGGTGEDCEGVVDASDFKSIRVCAASLPDAAMLPWGTRADFRFPGMSVAAGGVAADGDINYRAAPGLHISYLGVGPDGSSKLYRVTAFSYGGDASTAAVVQSTYRVGSSGVRDLGAE